jgi:hypothetical protein
MIRIAGNQSKRPPMVMTIEEDPQIVARLAAERAQYGVNREWYLTHRREIERDHLGRCICVAGQELFVADSPLEADALAQAAHPDDHGRLIRYVRRPNRGGSHAHPRQMD